MFVAEETNWNTTIEGRQLLTVQTRTGLHFVSKVLKYWQHDFFFIEKYDTVIMIDSQRICLKDGKKIFFLFLRIKLFLNLRRKYPHTKMKNVYVKIVNNFSSM